LDAINCRELESSIPAWTGNPTIVKTLVIGLDCLEPTLVERWIGDLPTFARLRAAGAWGRMRSCTPPITVPAWSCMMSSKDPGSLGIYGFRNRTDHTYKGLGFATGNWVKADRVWDILSAHGKKCAVLGVPGTYPITRPINGPMVSCFLTPNLKSAWASPPELKEEIAEWLGGRDYLFDIADFRSADKGRILEDIREMTRRRFTVARNMLARYAPDFFMMVEMGSDRIHHGFWHYMDPEHRKFVPDNPFREAIHDYYVLLDGEMAKLLEPFDLSSANLLVISDHGAKRLDGGICINDWLRREGYLTLKSEPAPGTPPARCEIDWSRTRAWGEGGYYARIFLNVRGREPEGIVAPEECERLCAELAARVKAIPDDLGRPLRTDAWTPRELYREVNGVPPDLIVIFGELSWRAVGTMGYDNLYLYENDTGPDEANHAQYGFFNWSGPAVTPGSHPVEIDILDVAPTLLRQMDIPPPPGMQGRLL
jgi:predicted AlkP superfamily phosphohydrolase/phosphomutase